MTYSYDANGNTLEEADQGTITVYGHNSQNQMVQNSAGGLTTNYQYNTDGIRHAQSDSIVTTHYLVDANRSYAQVLAESVNGSLDVAYHYGADLISQSRSGGVSYFHVDGLGSTRVLTDSSGSQTDGYAYAAFGEVLAQSGLTDNSYLYTGEQYDENLDQYYLRARYYDQGVGRFTQMDSWMGRNQDPITLHKFLYANAYPVNYTDPSGHFGIAGAINAVSVASSLATAAVVGYQFGSLIDRTARTGEVLSAENAKTAASIALSIVPLKYLTKVADLSAVAAKLERAGFASVIIDRDPRTKGFNKVFHWVQRLHKRGFTVEEALKALLQGKTWVDTKSGAVAKVLGNAKDNGTIKVLLVDGKITTVLSNKLGGKFVPFSPIDR